VGVGLIKSTDGGTTWGIIGSGLKDTVVRNLIVEPSGPAVVYALDPDFVRSDNAGASWEAKGDGLTAVSSASITVAPSDATVLYSGSAGIQKSTDGGDSWADLSAGGLTVSDVAVDASDSQVAFACGAGDVLKTTNGGITWLPSNSGLDNPIGFLNTIVSDASNDQTLFLGGGAGVFRSVDAGDTWEKIDSASSNTLLIDPLSPSTIYSGGIGVRRSLDGGATWTDASIGLTGVAVFGLAAPPGANATVFAAANDGIFLTTDGGDHWAPVVSFGALTLAIVFDPTNPQVAYVGTDGFGSDLPGVLVSTDGGSTWRPFNDGLDSFGSRRIRGLAIDPSGTNIFAATEAGVFAFTHSDIAPPAIVSVSPNSGSIEGGTPITLTGTGFAPGAIVLVGGASAGAVTVSETQIMATSPAGIAGGAAVEVINPDSQRSIATDAFAFDFLDVPTSALFHNAVVAISRRRITRGCGIDTFCPNGLLSRIQAAALIERAIHGPEFDFPIVEPTFSDVSVCDPLALYVAQFDAEALTNGCAPTKFCPFQTVTRSEMAAFLARAESPIPTEGDVDGSGYDCEAGGTSLFTDVAPTDPFCAAIHHIASLHVTFGCGGGRFCPDDAVTRWQAALFLARAFAAP
jgi:hypothetical protein